MVEGKIIFLFTEDLKFQYRKIEAKDIDWFMFDHDIIEKIRMAYHVVFIGLGQNTKVLKSRYGGLT